MGGALGRDQPISTTGSLRHLIFVDTNVFMYAVGRPHSLQEPAREFFAESTLSRTPLCTSAEVLQEMIHVYLPAGRLKTLDAAMSLVFRSCVEVWPLEQDDVTLARQLCEQYPTLDARDLCHLACCRRRGVSEIKTFDKTLLGASKTGSS